MDTLTVSFFRHGETKSNIEGRCAGRTDILITENGRRKLKELKSTYTYPVVQKLFSSPAIRCRETSDILFPGMEPEIIYGFWEMDYGILDNKPVDILASQVGKERWNKRDYSAFFPGGESFLEESFRALAAMTRVIQRCIEDNISTAAVVAHGDILNSLVRACLDTDMDLRNFLICPNGMGFEVQVDKEKWFDKQCLQFVRLLPEGAPRTKPEDTPFFQ